MDISRCWIVLLLVQLSVAQNEDVWLSDDGMQNYHQVIADVNMTGASGVIYSPNYPKNLTTTKPIAVKLVHLPYTCLLELEFTWLTKCSQDLKVVQQIMINNFTGQAVPLDIPITRRIMTDECYTLRMLPVENMTAFSIRYAISRLHVVGEVPLTFSPMRTRLRNDTGAGLIDLKDRTMTSGAVISSLSYNVQPDTVMDNSGTDTDNSTIIMDNSTTTSTTYTMFNSKTAGFGDQTKFALDIRNPRATDTILNIQLVKLDFWPCKEGNVKGNNKCGTHNKHNCDNKAFVYMGVSSIAQHSSYNETQYRRCYNCGTKNNLEDSSINYNLSMAGDSPEKHPRIYFKFRDVPDSTGFLVKYTIYGCPWEGRGFAAVRRHGLTELMDIDCENGTKLYHVCGDESVGSVCRDNGNWECDPRCIPDNDPRWIPKKMPAEALTTEADSTHKLFTRIVSPITGLLLVLLLILALVVYKQRKRTRQPSHDGIEEQISPQNDREISDVMIEVDDLTGDTSYVNVAMETDQQKTSVEIHTTVEEKGTSNNNNPKKETEKKSITVSFTRK